MRNYVNELKEKGYTEQAIAKQSGVSRATIHNVSTGKTRIKATSKTYETIRNTNRRLASEYGRAHGMTSKQATANRRTLFNPERKPLVKNTRITVKSKSNQTVRQYFIFAEFTYPDDTNIPNQFAYGFSQATKSRAVKVLREKAIENAIAKLSGGFGHYYWELVPPILQEGFTTHELKNTKAR